jgi:hypothetical protein
MQSRSLLGNYADGLAGSEHFWVGTAATKPGYPAGVASVVNGQLQIVAGGVTYLGANPLIVGWTLGGALSITSASASSDPNVTLYGLYHAAGAQDYCEGGKAVPLQGKWSLSGLHVAVSSAISFGCADGVALKCVEWGFIPVYGGPPLSGNGGVPNNAWDYHQACTRMGRADYCATGETHTRDGTTIDLYDDLVATSVFATPPVVVSPPPPTTASWPPAPGAPYFEAAWRGGSLPPVCLSRLRWQSLPLNGCPGLGDPRTQPGALFCDDMTANQMALAGALTYNASPFHDLGMHRWQTTSGTIDRVTTVHGFHDVAAPGTTAPPFATGTYAYNGIDGIVIRSLPGSIQPSDVVEVRMYSTATNHVVTTAATRPPGHSDDGFEGFIFIDQAPATVALKLFSNASGDYTTTTLAPPGGYTFRKTVGYVWY